jgi:hypothetical protein
MPSRWFTALILTATSFGAYAEESEWLGLSEPLHNIGVNVGADTEDLTVVGINGQFTLPNYSQLALAYDNTENELDDTVTSDAWLLSLASDPLQKWSFSGAYQLVDNDSSVESQDIELQAQYYPGNWSLRLGVSRGEVNADNPLTEFFDNEQVRQRFGRDTEINRSGLSLLYSLYRGDWRVDFSGQAYEYDDELPEGLIDRRLLLAISQQTVSGLFDLTDHRVGMALNYQTGDLTYQISASTFQYAIGEDTENNLSAGVTWFVSDSVSVSAFAASGLKEDIYFGESVLRFHW